MENVDVVTLSRSMRKSGEKRSFDWLFWLVSAIVLIGSYLVFRYEASIYSDLSIHAGIASEFDFRDLHSITQRLAYPAWHICVAVLIRLGLPLSVAAAGVTALSKTLVYMAGHRIIRVSLHKLSGDAMPYSRAVVTLASFALVAAASVWLPSVNANVYRGYNTIVGSPNVWHNPTQNLVTLSMLLCVPYTLHCWFSFQRELLEGGDRTTLPWRRAAVLAALLLFSLTCKPTFMQALLPAAACFFLMQWIRHPKNSRYFVRVILAFLPAVIYFLIQYLYYTGVLVAYTSGAEFGATWESAWLSVRNVMMMAAFPLLAIAACWRKDTLRDQTLVLSLLIMLWSMLEAMFFRETGLRQNHGNFSWANGNAAFLLWVVMLPRYIASVGATLASIRERRRASRPIGAAEALRVAAYILCAALIVWHLVSMGVYIRYLFASQAAF